jgi:hypothetical protein
LDLEYLTQILPEKLGDKLRRPGTNSCRIKIPGPGKIHLLLNKVLKKRLPNLLNLVAAALLFSLPMSGQNPLSF